MKDKKITIRVNESFYKAVKIAAIKRNMSLTKFVIQAVEMKMAKFDLIQEKK